MGLIAWIFVGAIAGYLANKVLRSRGGLLRMILLGVVGGIVGGFIATGVLNMGPVNGITLESLVVATVGAVAVIFIARIATGSTALPQA